MTTQEGLTRHPGLGEPRRDQTPEMAFMDGVEWRSPLFHYYPDGLAAMAMANYMSGIRESTLSTTQALTKEPARKRYEASQRIRQEIATKTRHENMGLWIEHWEDMSENCLASLLDLQGKSDTLLPSPSLPLVPLKQEQQILETIYHIKRSDEVAAYQKAGKSWDVPKGNLTVPLPDGGKWVDTSDHYTDSMYEVAQLPALAAVLALSGNRRDTRILCVASSYGLELKMMQLAGFTNVMGIDIDKNAVEFAQSQGLNMKVMDASQMDVPDETFDIVVSRNLLVHGYAPYPSTKEGGINRVPFLNEQHRVVRNGGVIVLINGYKCRPLSLGSLPTEDIVASRLQNAEHTVATGLVSQPMIYQSDFYPIWIFQK